MKKLCSILGVIIFIAGISVAPAMAGQFSADILQCGAPGTATSCGSNVAAVDPLGYGSVQVDGMGNVTVQLIGAAPNATYRVYVGNWVTGGAFQMQFSGDSANGSVGTIATDDQGNFCGVIISDTGNVFVFPGGTAIGQLSFSFDNPDSQPQFTSGFQVGQYPGSNSMGG